MLWTGRGHSASRAGAIAFGSRVTGRVPSSDGTGRQAGAGGAADAGDSIWGAGNRFLATLVCNPDGCRGSHQEQLALLRRLGRKLKPHQVSCRGGPAHRTNRRRRRLPIRLRLQAYLQSPGGNDPDGLSPEGRLTTTAPCAAELRAGVWTSSAELTGGGQPAGLPDGSRRSPGVLGAATSG